MSGNWRLIPYETHDAASNMAIDEAILDAHVEGLSPPTLRLYGWQPGAVSIGYGQRISPAVLERIFQRGFDVVRRPTGGRAVLHEGELTYSFVGSAGGAGRSQSCANLSESVLVAYKQISQGLILAFRSFGITLSLGTSSRNYRDRDDCFMATTGADLHYLGKKMIGSAQLRRQSGILQHGSILLDQRQDLMPSLLCPGNGERSLDGTADSGDIRHANLFEVLGRALPIESLQESLKGGFEEAFARTFQVGALSDYEVELAERHRMKYQHA